MGRLTFAGVAWFFLVCVTLAAWLAALPGCTVDDAGLSNSLVRRGEIDANDDAGHGAPDVTPATDPDVAAEETGGIVSTDGGVDGIVPVSPDSSAKDDASPPSECPIIELRSVTPCSASATVAVCRYYYTPGMATLQGGCHTCGQPEDAALHGKR